MHGARCGSVITAFHETMSLKDSYLATKRHHSLIVYIIGIVKTLFNGSRIHSSKRSMGNTLPRKSQPIYLDYNATTPLRKEVIDTMKPYLEHFGNPSSSHVFGTAPKRALAEARLRVAEAIHAPTPDAVYFCSCGTEADNWAIWSAVCTYKSHCQGKIPHVLSTVVEHPAVIKFLEQLESMGMCEYSLMEVSKPEGLLERDVLEKSMRENTCLVSVMHSNNEIGTIQDFSMICSALEKENERRTAQGGRPILLHSDMAQSVGRCQLDVQSNDLMIDMGTIVAHKFGGPKGIAALYIRPGVDAVPLLAGGGQERGLRSGTECILLAAGMGEAIYQACRNVDLAIAEMRGKRDLLRKALTKLLFEDPRVVYRIHETKDPKQQLPNTLAFSIRGIDSRQVISKLSDVLAISAGSACHSSASGPGGSVLEGIGCPADLQAGTFRLSIGHFTTTKEIEQAAIILSNAIKEEFK